ncbi:MAG: T9SS type A sorting domain-containing protein [Bacteroidetes bacterium]|nr:T9SS type A sorting domain-containing protein [Bacteroidota bacterium]
MSQKILAAFFTLFSFTAMASGLRVSSLGASFLVMAAVQQEQRATIFPNPAKDRIYVKGATAARIELINMIGEPVLDEPLTASGLVLLTDIQPGMYIVHIYDADGTVILSTRLTRQ